MKKIILVLMSITMLLSLSACGGSTAPAATPAPVPAAEPAPTAQPESEAAPAAGVSLPSDLRRYTLPPGSPADAIATARVPRTSTSITSPGFQVPWGPAPVSRTA